MSDRFVRHASKRDVEQLFKVSTPREDYFEADYNIKPGNRVPIIVYEDQKRRVHRAQWGLIPEGAEEEREGVEYHELEVEEAVSKDPYQQVIQLQRCLIPANGFYKWKTGKKESTPFYIRLLSNELFAMAGIYSIWKSDSGRDVYSFSLITTDANALVQPVDDKMPVILEQGDYGAWLGESEKKVEKEALLELMQPYDLTKMAVNRVSEEVNDPTNNDPSLIQPIPK